jgi:hypothetical protein
MGEKKHVPFYPEKKHDSKYVRFHSETTLTESEMVFINIGQEMYHNGLHFEEDKEDKEEDKEDAPLTNKSMFRWNDTCIADISDPELRNVCIVMYQAIAMNKRLNNGGNKDEDSTKLLFETMQILGYLGEMECAVFQEALEKMKS